MKLRGFCLWISVQLAEECCIHSSSDRWMRTVQRLNPLFVDFFPPVFIEFGQFLGRSCMFLNGRRRHHLIPATRGQ